MSLHDDLLTAAAYLEGDGVSMEAAEADRIAGVFRSYATALCQQGEPTEAARDVLAERARQISAEGWTPEHDDEHVNGELAFAASSYAYHASSRSWVLQDFADGAECYASDEPPNYWPYSWDESWWKPKNPRRDLVRAAALILAEIERLDRRALSTSEGKTE